MTQVSTVCTLEQTLIISNKKNKEILRAHFIIRHWNKNIDDNFNEIHPSIRFVFSTDSSVQSMPEIHLRLLVNAFNARAPFLKS